jgi:hypothetical protein
MRASWNRTVVSAAVVTTFSLLLAGSALAATITTFTPTAGTAATDACTGTVIQISGTGFADEVVKSVAFNGVPAAWFQVGSNVLVYAIVPATAASGAISVTTSAGTATSAAPLTVLPCQGLQKPTTPAGSGSGTAASASITSFKPLYGKAGTTVTITGTGFKGATSVKIGGAAAAFKVISGTKLTAKLPAKAKSGKIVVKTAAGTATSDKGFVKI